MSAALICLNIFFTAPRDQGSGKCKAACLQSLSRLRLDYLDLMLIHWPGTQGLKHDDKQNPVLRSESWRDMLELYKAGRTYTIFMDLRILLVSLFLS